MIWDFCGVLVIRHREKLPEHGEGMKPPTARMGWLIAGFVVQVPVLGILMQAVFNMHNRFSVFQSLLLPYAAIGDRLHHPPFMVMAVVLFVTLFQFPLYGILIGYSQMKGRLASAIVGVAIVHGIASAIAIYMKAANM